MRLTKERICVTVQKGRVGCSEPEEVSDNKTVSYTGSALQCAVWLCFTVDLLAVFLAQYRTHVMLERILLVQSRSLGLLR